jgi:hypothetical protein
MAQQNRTAAEAAAQLTEVDADALEKAAMAIYLDLVKGEMRGRDGKLVAQAAYARARDFVLVTQAIRGGAEIPTSVAPQSLPVLYCKVTLWDLTLGEHGAPVKDNNGRTVEEIQPVDRDAFAPNLPEDHPINQRYYPNALKSNRICDLDGKAIAVASLN